MGMRFCHMRRTWAVVAVLSASLLTSPGWAITSKITRQSTSKELLQGKTDGVVVTSRGTIQLGRAAKVLASEFEAPGLCRIFKQCQRILRRQSLLRIVTAYFSGRCAAW